MLMDRSFIPGPRCADVMEVKVQEGGQGLRIETLEV